MCSRQSEWSERPGLQPFRSSRAARLLTEEVAAIALWRQRHVGSTLRPDPGLEALYGDAAIDDTPQDAKVIGQRSHVIMLRVAGIHRLRVEVIRVDEIRVARADVERRGQDLLGRKYPVELREG